MTGAPSATAASSSRLGAEWYAPPGADAELAPARRGARLGSEERPAAGRETSGGPGSLLRELYQNSSWECWLLAQCPEVSLQ